MNHIRHGLASALGLVLVGVLASCVSGTDSNGGGPDGASGGQGNAATGNQGPHGGSSNSAGGTFSVGGHGGTTSPQGGTTSAQAGTTNSQAGTNALGGSSGMPGAGGTPGTAGSTSAGGAGGAGGKGTAGTTSMAGTTGAAGTSSGPQPLPPITGSQGFLTRFWDCCKPSCGGGKVTCGPDGKTQSGDGSACNGGTGHACYDLSPFVDSANPYVAYAFGATNPQECGACYEIQFTGKAGCGSLSSCPGNSLSLVYNTLYLQGINTGSDVAQGQFDVMIPGGGVGIFDGCTDQWKPQSSAGLGPKIGGFFGTDMQGDTGGCAGNVTCYNAKCNSMFSSQPDLLAGCLWFSSWLKAADNPQITYTKVACPQVLRDRSGF